MKTTILWFYDIHLSINTKANKRSEFFCHVFVASRIQHYRLSLKLYLGWPFITLTLAFRTSSGFQIFVASFLQNLMLQSEQVQFKWYCQIFCKFLSPLCWIWCQTAEEALIFFRQWVSNIIDKEISMWNDILQNFQWSVQSMLYSFDIYFKNTLKR